MENRCHSHYDPDPKLDLEPECLQWYYNNYDILIPFYHFFMDGLAWDLLEPHKLCVTFENCDETKGLTREMFKKGFYHPMLDFIK